jgi:hypothetical protein
VEEEKGKVGEDSPVGRRVQIQGAVAPDGPSKVHRDLEELWLEVHVQGGSVEEVQEEAEDPAVDRLLDRVLDGDRRHHYRYAQDRRPI